jgi:hypothetical protein
MLPMGRLEHADCTGHAHRMAALQRFVKRQRLAIVA